MVASEDSLRFPPPPQRCAFWISPILVAGFQITIGCFLFSCHVERGIMTALVNVAWLKTQLRTLALNLLRLVQLMRLLLPSHWLCHHSEASFFVVNDVVNKIAIWIVQLALKARNALFITRRSGPAFLGRRV